MKITAIHGGGDWYDASADYLVLPPGMDLNHERREWNDWYRDAYLASRRDGSPKVEYMRFPEWLVKVRGAREATSDELEVFEN